MFLIRFASVHWVLSELCSYASPYIIVTTIESDKAGSTSATFEPKRAASGGLFRYGRSVRLGVSE
jgi:hypothetical protein